MGSSQNLPPRPNKPRWSDLDDEEDNGEELNFLLPPTQVIGPDNNGIKKVIECKFNDEGRMVKITTSRVRKIETRTKKQVVERRSWHKFGDAVNEDVGAMLTVVSNENIFLERPEAQGSATNESKTAEASEGQLGNKGALLTVCRSCGKKGDHWTTRCPYKDLAMQAEATNLNDKTVSDAENAAAHSSSGFGNMSKYIPPSQRGGADKSTTAGSSDTKYRNNENKVKVSNLSEDAGEEDLRELFGVFGPITRVYVPSDRCNGLNRGFGFVSFVHREDAERAINKLNGYGYDNLILEVDWAPSRPK